jgi:anti-sigma factor RsiW
MTTKRVTHRKIFRHICENLDREMDSPECREIRRHMKGCPECFAYLDSLKTTVALYRRYAAPPLSEASRRRLRSLVLPKR